MKDCLEQYLLEIYLVYFSVHVVNYLKEPKKLTSIFKSYGEIDTFRFRSVPVLGVKIEKYNQKTLKKVSIT